MEALPLAHLLSAAALPHRLRHAPSPARAAPPHLLRLFTLTLALDLLSWDKAGGTRASESLQGKAGQVGLRCVGLCCVVLCCVVLCCVVLCCVVLGWGGGE